ncbi:hypothetical protein PR202_gb03868 [Eleusine coracana subsp. coracana]|uniref:Uncharacterized protein n=1 Tax=Eleusine coracana subsp. coracana TaxID=191504 RepID=A0AAV5E0L7_ELECO|nr:hypothetical protein PR202_gb03868 [Eleusine coracana subsp. coracana]
MRAERLSVHVEGGAAISAVVGESHNSDTVSTTSRPPRRYDDAASSLLNTNSRAWSYRFFALLTTNATRFFFQKDRFRIGKRAIKRRTKQVVSECAPTFLPPPTTAYSTTPSPWHRDTDSSSCASSPTPTRR